MAKSIGTIAGMIRIWCAIALAMVGLAHMPAMAMPQRVPAEMAAYVLPDGTVPSLCVSDHADTKPQKAAYPGCEACRLSATMLIPPPAQLAEAVVYSIPAVLSPAGDIILVQRLYPPSARPRAPPAVTFLT